MDGSSLKIKMGVSYFFHNFPTGTQPSHSLKQLRTEDNRRQRKRNRYQVQTVLSRKHSAAVCLRPRKNLCNNPQRNLLKYHEESLEKSLIKLEFKLLEKSLEEFVYKLPEELQKKILLEFLKESRE